MEYLPLFVDLKERPCLVVGGGDIAARKVGLLRKARANVTIVAPDVSAKTQMLIDMNEVSWTKSLFSEDLLQGCSLVIAATDNEQVNRKVHQAAKAHNILVNVADCPELCDFILPSILDRSPIVIAVSSGGKSPILARQLRARLETLIPASYGYLAEMVGRYRRSVQDKLPKIAMRSRFWETILQGKVADHIFAGRYEAGEALLQATLDDVKADDLQTGEVYLVGAGPGDPDLLTFKALRLMQQADIVFYDRLVSPEILALVRREAKQVYVGKQRAWHTVRQEQINQLLLQYAKQGKRVLRLKGGDPFIFGRGGEEIETLASENITFQVVPGVTAASGCASYAGIPLTHRDYSQSCIFVAGQLKQGELDLNWPALVQARQTVVVYMGLAGLAVLSQHLQQHGMQANMPVAIIQQGTTTQQKVWVSTIAEISELAEREKPTAPTLLIIGEVVKLHKSLSWFEVKDESHN